MEFEFVPLSFTVPLTLEGAGLRFEPLGPEHNERDYEAWMSSIDHIRSTPGFDDPGARWPYEMSRDDNLKDLLGHAKDFEARKGFTYSILEGDDVVGCVYIYPSELDGHDAEIRSWVTARRSELDVPVRLLVSNWLKTEWPFDNPWYLVAG